MIFILTIILSIIGYIQDSPIFFLAIICLLFFRLLIKALIRVAEDEDKFDNIMLAISDLKSDIESKLSEIQYEVSNLDITCHADP